VSSSASEILNAADEIAGIDFERLGQSRHRLKARVAFASLQGANVSTGDPRPVGKRLLGQAKALALAAYPIPEQSLAGRRSFPGSGHPAI